MATQMTLNSKTVITFELGKTDQAQEPGCGDEEWGRSVPASFATSVGMPSVEQHREERDNVGQSAEQADVQHLKVRIGS